MSPNAPRLRFQFSLRTLVIVVTVLCTTAGGYVLWQKKIVKEREELLELPAIAFAIPKPDNNALWIRRWLGDRAVVEIAFKWRTPPEVIEHLKQAFPEAKVREADPFEEPPGTKREPPPADSGNDPFAPPPRR